MSFYIIQCICFLEFYINIMLMRKFLSFFFVMAFYVVGAYAQVLVQGQPHPSARNISTKQESQLRADASFTFDDIQYWVGNGSNKAALVIEWHDGNRPDAMVWGYRWDGEATGHDMIVAIAQADPRLVLLTQYTGWMGYTIDGIGYGESRLNISYDLEGAKSEPKNAFKFEPPITNPLLGQTSHPEHPAEDVAAAIRQGVQTGVIYRVIDNPGLYALSNSRRYVPRRIFRKTSLPQQRIRNGRFKFESIIRFILGHIQIISDVQIIPISNTIDRITHPTRILG